MQTGCLHGAVRTSMRKVLWGSRSWGPGVQRDGEDDGTNRSSHTWASLLVSFNHPDSNRWRPLPPGRDEEMGSERYGHIPVTRLLRSRQNGEPNPALQTPKPTPFARGQVAGALASGWRLEPCLQVPLCPWPSHSTSWISIKSRL